MFNFLKTYLIQLLIGVIVVLIALNGYFFYKYYSLNSKLELKTLELKNKVEQLYLCKKNTQISIVNTENNQTAISSQARIDELLKELRDEKNTINNINLDDGVLFFKSKN